MFYAWRIKEMRKLFVCIISILLLSLSSFAQDISRQEALQYARDFFSDTPSARLDVVWTGSEDSSFYVINREGGGFLVLSGSRILPPVIGYSYSGSFKVKGMPDNVSAWFRGFEKDLKEAKALYPRPSEEVLQQWRSLGARTKAPVQSYVLESALWDQDEPFNDKCVMPNGDKVITGCVATAMAITFRHNKYPPHGFGSLEGYITSTNRYRIEGFSIEDHYYDWDNMPLTNVYGATAEQKAQIAQLMYDCGVLIHMDYSPTGSGAISMNMPAEVAEHFHYSPEALLYKKSMYKPREWLALLRNELDQDRLIFYSAQDANGNSGHAFVIDGYDENGLLHVNWGWSGSGNGFYDLDLRVGWYRFSNSQGAVLGLVPDPNQEKAPITHLALTSNGLSLASGRIEKGVRFSIRIDKITNYGNGDYAGPLQVVLTDENDNIKANLSSPLGVTITALHEGSYTIENCMLETVPAFKDRIALAAKNNSGEMEVLRSDVENESVGSLATVPNFISTKSSYSPGDTFELKLFKSGEKYNSATWYFDGVKVPADEDSVVLSAGEHIVKVVLEKSSGSESIIQEITVN